MDQKAVGEITSLNGNVIRGAAIGAGFDSNMHQLTIIYSK
jgi:hypothetical protein